MGGKNGVVFDVGIYAMDANGNKYYTPQDIAALTDPSEARYIVVNTQTLNDSSRNDGTYGNGFIIDLTYWKIDKDRQTGASRGLCWSNPNTRLDTDILPLVADYTDTTKKTYYAGVYNTDNIISLGSQLGIITPYATACRQEQIEIKGEIHKGFLPALGQYVQMTGMKGTPFNTINELVSAAGYSELYIDSGSYGHASSCQEQNSGGTKCNTWIYYPNDGHYGGGRSEKIHTWVQAYVVYDIKPA